jgi:hypothetical protein
LETLLQFVGIEGISSTIPWVFNITDGLLSTFFVLAHRLLIMSGGHHVQRDRINEIMFPGQNQTSYLLKQIKNQTLNFRVFFEFHNACLVGI